MIIRIAQVIMGDAASATEMTHSLYLASSLCYSGTSVLNSVTLHTSNFHLLYFGSLMYNRHSERCQNITKPKVWWLSQHSKIGTFKSMTSGTICPARVWTAACLKVPGHGWGDCVTLYSTRWQERAGFQCLSPRSSNSDLNLWVTREEPHAWANGRMFLMTDATFCQ